MEVKIEAVSYLATSNSLESSHKKLADVKPTISARSSDSATMDEFEKRIKELKKLVGEYRELLENDGKAFREVADVFSAADKKAATEYLKEKGATHKKGGTTSGGHSTSGSGVR